MPAFTFLRDLPITRKLTFFSVLISVSCLIGALSVIALYDRYGLEEETHNELVALASMIASRSSIAIENNDHPDASAYLQPLVYNKHIVTACIYMPTLNRPIEQTVDVIARYPSKEVNCPLDTPSMAQISKNTDTGHISITAPILSNSSIVGYVYLNSHAGKMVTLQKMHSITIAIIGLIASLLALLLSRLFSKALARPLLSLETTTRNITRDDNYSLRAANFGNDEVGKVVNSFNHMLDFFQHEDSVLRESEEKFRLISDASKVGIFQLDTSGKCVYANAELSLICGLSNRDIISGNWLTTVHPDDQKVVEQQWQTMLSDGRPIYLDCRLTAPGIRHISGHVGLLKRKGDQLAGYLGTITDVTEIKNAQMQLEQMAFYDMLTGLANRRLFRNRLEHVVNNLSTARSSLGLILVNLDRFKSINDTLGHDSADKLLKVFAERLQQCVRASDTVARLGGNEFAIILSRIKDSSVTTHVAEKVLTSIQQPVTWNENELRITASIGIAIAPENGLDAETIIKNADMALFHAKDKGRNNYQLFTTEMNNQLMQHLALIQDLRAAVKNKDFALAFQPKICLRDGKLIGFEALIRWHHATKGTLSPAEFIPVAEETGLIIPLGRWVITAACKQLRTMYDTGAIAETVTISVNLSAHQFQDETLVDFIAGRIKDFNLKPGQFEVELTETVLMENVDKAIEKLDALRKLGILISIDDFGTGYSSLGYLKRLPVNIVKVDRSFVDDIPYDKSDMEITAAVIAMAHNLNYKVVAEGIETDQQLSFLEQCGCDYGQGYLFSKPLSERDLETYCRSFSAQRSRSKNEPPTTKFEA